MLCEFCSTREATHTNVPTLFGLHTQLCPTCFERYEQTREFPRPADRRRRKPVQTAPRPDQLTFDFLHEAVPASVLGF